MKRAWMCGVVSIAVAGRLVAAGDAIDELAFVPQMPPSQAELLEEADARHEAELLALEEERKREELAREEEMLARTVKFFEAIADADRPVFEALLNEGMDPDVELPFPAPEGFAARFDDKRLKYYITSERGFTALMLATCLGNESFVRMLLEAGAYPYKMTKRHKTFALWLAGRYAQIEIMRMLMGIGPEAEVRRLRLKVDLAAQRATLFQGSEVLFTSPISSGKKSHPTPTGEFLVTNKYRTWTSTLYHAKMPNFLRLSCGDFGLHAGALPGYPASHGCIRLPADKAKELFALAPVGTFVEIE